MTHATDTGKHAAGALHTPPAATVRAVRHPEASLPRAVRPSDNRPAVAVDVVILTVRERRL